MTIQLTPDDEAFIAREVAAGRASPPADVMRRALHHFRRGLEELHEAIAEAEAQIARGDVVSDKANAFATRMREKYAHLIDDAAHH